LDVGSEAWTDGGRKRGSAADVEVGGCDSHDDHSNASLAHLFVASATEKPLGSISFTL
jgi:hypothetical protein